VYVDNDPVVLTHARALLTSGPAGRCDYVCADVRDQATILQAAASTLDLSRPVAVLMLLILHLIPDVDDPYLVVSSLLAAMPGGSYLVLAHPASDVRPDAVAEMTRADEPAARRDQGHTARPGRHQQVLRRAGAGRPRGGPAPAVAPRSGRAGAGGGDRVVRRGR
jgi:hypothetical protein